MNRQTGDWLILVALTCLMYAALASSGSLFYGSTRVGKLIAMICARHLKPVVLELGGKAPPVVLGSVVGMGTVEHCNALIDDAVAKGARLVCGGKADSALMPATLLGHVTPRMRIDHEETFGPVKAIVRVDRVEAAVACGNDNEYGLSAAVFGRDIARALNVARRIESGICHVDGPTVHDEAQMPFGGVKGSGLGRFGGKAGIAEFTELRWITLQTQARQYPF